MKYKIIIILLSLLVSFAIEAQNCFISEGKEWTVDGMMYGSDDTCIRFTNKHKISQVENVDGKIIAILQAKSWRAATEFEPSEWSGNVVITECDDKLYIGERLVFDMGLQVGDRFVWSEEQAWENLTVTGIDYREIEGVKRKCIYLCCAEDPNITDIWIEGIGSMIYGIENEPLMKVGASTKMISCIENGIEVYSDEPLDYEYAPLVREGVVWHYSYYGELYKFSFLGEEEIDGKIYRKCYKFDEKSDITESNGTLIAYLREENRQVYSILDDSEETMIYDFNLKVGDIYNSLYNQFAITAIDYVSINNCLTKRFQLERENEWIVEGVGVVSEMGHYFFCPFYPTPSGTGMSLPPVLYKQTTIDGQVLVSYTLDSIEKVTQNELLISQAENVVIINGATGKVDVAIYTFDGMKAAEASGSESVSLSTAELPIGIYVVKATDSTGNKLIQKIVIK